jgi:hypothetical protein
VTLTVTYAGNASPARTLAALRPLLIHVTDVGDTRPEPDKVGYRRSLFGIPGAPFHTSEPVPKIFHDALVAEFIRSGHRVVSEDADFLIAGTVSTFWLNLGVGFWEWDLVGTAAVELRVASPVANETVFTGQYHVDYEEKSAFAGVSVLEHVMNVTLERLVWKIGTDPDLIRALGAQRNRVVAPTGFEPVFQP